MNAIFAEYISRNLKTPAQDLAFLVTACAKVHRESYDRVAADAATVKADAEKMADKDNIYAGMVDYSKFYKLTLREACEQTCKMCLHEELAEPVYLLLSLAWNDIAAWAEEHQKK